MHSLIKTTMLVLALATVPAMAQAGTLEGAAIGAGASNCAVMMRDSIGGCTGS